jgi:hypothetical protein
MHSLFTFMRACIDAFADYRLHMLKNASASLSRGSTHPLNDLVNVHGDLLVNDLVDGVGYLLLDNALDRDLLENNLSMSACQRQVSQARS